jgi:phosphatidate cytidylyltransferase
MINETEIRAYTGILLILLTAILSTTNFLSFLGIIYLSISCNIEYNSVNKLNNFIQKTMDIYLIIITGLLYYNELFEAGIVAICFYILINLYFDVDIISLSFKSFYTIILPNQLVFLLDNQQGLFSFSFNTNLFVFVMICWFTDIACYISGKLFKNPHILNEKLGKGKTIEGIIGGYFFGTIFSLLLQNIFIGKVYQEFTLLLPFLSITGDIVESAIKRKLQIKDFGNVFPGHGGFLDRFDSVIFSTIIIKNIKF